MPFADHFSALAARYATYRPHYPPALVGALADRCAGHALAWDAGCGSGQLSTALAARFDRVIATEPSAAQLADAEGRGGGVPGGGGVVDGGGLPRAGSAAEGRGGVVEYRQETAEQSTLADASADLTVAAQAAHWFDWPRYVAEVARVAKPGALVGLVTYGDHAVDGPAEPVVAAHIRAVFDYWPPGREHVRNHYRDLVWPWPVVEMPAIEMTAAWTRDELAGYLATSSAAARERTANGPGRLEALVRDLEAAVPDPAARITIRWPLTVKLARR